MTIVKILRKECVPIIEEFYGLEKDALAKIWLADKVYDVLAEEDCAEGVINMVAENIREYGK